MHLLLCLTVIDEMLFSPLGSKYKLAVAEQYLLDQAWDNREPKEKKICFDSFVLSLCQDQGTSGTFMILELVKLFLRSSTEKLGHDYHKCSKINCSVEIMHITNENHVQEEGSR